MTNIQLVTFLLGLSTAAKVIDCDSRPNVLLLIIDDFRPALGSYGEQVITPNMDQLAAQSIRFTDAHAQQALCAPSRISLLTSRRPDSTLLWDFRSSYWRDSAGNFTTLPQHFKDNGYFTVSSGKVFHKGACSNFTDDYPLSWSVPVHRPTSKREKGIKQCPGLDGNLHSYTMCPVNVTLMPGGTLPDIETSDYAISVLQSLSRTRGKHNKKKKKKNDTLRIEELTRPHLPFFLAVGYYKPHLPFRYPQEYKDLYPIDSIEMAKNPFYTANLPAVAWEHWKDVRRGDDIPLSRRVPDYFEPMPKKYHLLMRQAYFATTSYIDYQVGRVLSTLEEEGLADDTIIALLGDHGWQLGEHQEWSKYSNFASATQVPLMFYVPGVTDRTGSLYRRRFPLNSAFDRLHPDHNLHPQHPHPSGQTTPGESPIDLSDEPILYRHNSGLVSHALAELVDVFPTVAELAGLPVPPLCPLTPTGVTFCTEGVSLAPVINRTVGRPTDLKIRRWKKAAFSQYPRPTFFPSHKTNTPSLSRINIMGYSMRTKEYRYAEWLPFNNSNYHVDWSGLLARELYLYDQDPSEDVNVAEMPENIELVRAAAHQLRLNWRHALPVFYDGDLPTTDMTTPPIVSTVKQQETRNGAASFSSNALITGVVILFQVAKVACQIILC
ncbi:iduronate 2-sulfatase-like [Patiria miniata]|uniref:Sulfatase N-terminal domain-containing protein n=1 Tax=Patiria miniata TaxID=46514 RepID=A0A914AI22_PATMI|nr:iduronate 2-sulfatase-like [Patiria miniata]